MLQLFVGFLISFSFLFAPFSFLFESTTALMEPKKEKSICSFVGFLFRSSLARSFVVVNIFLQSVVARLVVTSFHYLTPVLLLLAYSALKTKPCAPCVFALTSAESLVWRRKK